VPSRRRRASIGHFDNSTKDFFPTTSDSPHRVIQSSGTVPHDDSARVKSSVQLVAVAVCAVVLIVGAFFGLRPISTDVTVVSPELATLTVPCGIGYLPGVPGTGDPVAVKADSSVLLPRAAYQQHCDLVTGWQPYVAWALTGVSLLGLALLFVGRRNRVGVWPAS
jgi:hypothetical protein